MQQAEEEERRAASLAARGARSLASPFRGTTRGAAGPGRGWLQGTTWCCTTRRREEKEVEEVKEVKEKTTKVRRRI